MNFLPNRGNFFPVESWQNTPKGVAGLSGWWRQGIGITAASERVSQWNDQSGNARHLLQATGANQPIYLPYSGANYAWCPGVASNNLSVPTKVITGNFRITLDFSLDDFTPGSTYSFLNKSGGTNGFFVQMLSTGRVRLAIGDGAALTSVDSVSPTGWADMTRHTLRIDWEDGVGATFFYDGVQSGSQVAAAKTLTNFSTPLQFGFGTATAAKFYSFSLTDDASTTYYSVDFTKIAEGTTSFVQNGDTYTVNATGAKQAQIVGSPQVVGDGAAYFMRASYTQAQPVTRFVLARRNTWVGSPTFARLMDGGAINGAAFYDSGSTPSLAISAGTGLSGVTTATIGAYHAIAAVFNGATSSLYADTASISGNAGTATTEGLTLFANGLGSGAFGGWQAKEIIEYNRALSTSEVAAVMRYLSRMGNLGLAL